MRPPFSIERLDLLRRGLQVDRTHPDLARLSRIEDPLRFCWQILPYVARTFAVSISLLPRPEAEAAAVAYLYARILDSYEDLHPDPPKARMALRSFAARFGSAPPDPPPPLPADLVRDDRDRVYLLLVDRCLLVDVVFGRLAPRSQSEIRTLLERMAEGMVWASETFQSQAGVLVDDEQLFRYCHTVIGEPSLFVLRLMAGRPLRDVERQDALEVSVLIQLANITRDIERDLTRGIGYHPMLRPHLGDGASSASAVHSVRSDLTLTALARAPAYRRLADSWPFPYFSPERAASVAMFSFTEAHYRHQARMLGVPTGRIQGKGQAVAIAVAAGLSPRRARRRLARTEASMLTLAEAIRREEEGAHQPAG